MRTALLLACLCATAALADPDEAKAKMEKKVETLKKSAEKEARSSSSEGCKELVAESRVACGEMFTRGLKTNCFMFVTALQLGAEQAKGKLFKMDDADQDVKVANASCRVHLRSLRRDRDKAKDLPDAAQAPQACRDLAAELDGCFGAFEQSGTFATGCTQVIQMTMSPALRAQSQCGGLLQMLKKQNGAQPGAPH